MDGKEFEELKKEIALEKKAVKELETSLNHLENARDAKEKKMVREHVNALKNSMKKSNENVLIELEKINVARPLVNGNKEPAKVSIQGGHNQRSYPEGTRTSTRREPSIEGKNLQAGIEKNEKKKIENLKKKIFLTGDGMPKGLSKSAKQLSVLEREVIKRIKKKRQKVERKEIEKPKKYTKIANQIFYNTARKISTEKSFDTVRKDLMKTNLAFTPITYLSLILFTTLISAIVGFFIFIFFLFFRIGFESPIITIAQENFGLRLLKVFWIIFMVPIITFLFMYFYPSLEKKSGENKINHELPFAAIHMSAISQSLIEPSKIFSIIITTKEYPNLEKEFIKIMNQINVYGYDLVTALRSTAMNCPSKKLSDLLNGLATTITSGGGLSEFFDKRAQTLLFEHRLEEEKATKAAETFMDIYISVVIAAPMIFMLLLMMMRISGLGISIGTSSITLLMILGVSLLNIAFISFLQLKKSK